MSETAELKLPNETVSLPIVVGSEGEYAVDISKLRAKSGQLTLLRVPPELVTVQGGLVPTRAGHRPLRDDRRRR